jgi:hypothetical protein
MEAASFLVSGLYLPLSRTFDANVSISLPVPFPEVTCESAEPASFFAVSDDWSFNKTLDANEAMPEDVVFLLDIVLNFKIFNLWNYNINVPSI